MSDTPAIESLPPALEEAARSIAHEWMERLGYAPGIPEQAQRWLDAGEHEDFDAVYDLKKTLRFVRFVLERVPRDPAAELVEALEAVTKAEYDSGVGEYAITAATMRRVQAALARVKEQR